MFNSLWSVTLDLPLAKDITYRYCICLFVNANDGETKTVVRRWETDLTPRKVGCHVPSNVGRADPANSADIFGCITTGPEQPLVQTGWLVKESLVELKLYENAIQIWKRKHREKDFYVKVTPIDVRLANQMSMR